MSNNYPYYPQQTYRPATANPYMDTMQQSNQFMGIKGRPVSSLEEARAMSIDFDGSVFYFPDLANHKIYTKQINLDGTATLNIYEYKELPPEPQVQSFITREEFNSVIEQLKTSFQEMQQQQQQLAAPIGKTETPQIKF